MIIGLCGKAGAGKSEAAKALCEAGFCKVSFATALKTAASYFLFCTGNDLKFSFDLDDKNAMIPSFGITKRELWQKFGTDFVRNMIGENVWVNVAFARMDSKKSELGSTMVVFDDVRFKNEIEAIKNKGGFIVWIDRDVNKLDSHFSENAINKSMADFVIDNNSDIGALNLNIIKAINNLLKRDKHHTS